MPKISNEGKRRKGVLADRPELRAAFDRLKEDPPELAPLDRIILNAIRHWSTSPFPIHVFPGSVQKYILASARSIVCSYDLMAVPLLAIAGAAIGRSGRRLKVKDGWTESSCLWAVCLIESSEGKTPALKAVDCFYQDKQREVLEEWRKAKKEFDENPDTNEDPGPQPKLVLTDTTLESLRYDLLSGPVLYENDELGAWCHQMGQYKGGNADKPAWTSFWSHSSVSIGRRTDSLRLEDPFVAVAGMMVPGSARDLNFKGHADDGFVHRMLLSCPPQMPMVFSSVGVPDALTETYKWELSKLFEPVPEGKNKTLTVAPDSMLEVIRWYNDIFAPEVGGKRCPDWLKAKYKKLFNNFWRICLVLHELRRVAGNEDEKSGFDEMTIDSQTVESAIQVVDYFKEHIPMVQNYLGDTVTDAIEGLYHRLNSEGKITLRVFKFKSSFKTNDRALPVWAEWERRGYGHQETGNRVNQQVFVFT